MSEARRPPVPDWSPQARRGPRLAAAGLLATAVILGAALRWAAIEQKPGLSHDEGISYLAATGHLGEFSLIVPGNGSPAGRWANAREWRRYMECDGFGRFRTIGFDLAHHDIHPPLYFWLLHAWLCAAGTGVRAGSLFNVCIAVVTTLVLAGFARWALGDQRAAAWVALLWAVSPHAVAEPLEARPYGLLALLSLVFIRLLVGLLERERAGVVRPALLAAVTAAGALTHFLFVVVAAGGAVFAAATTLRRAPRGAARLATVAGSLALGAALAWAAHPDFWLSIARQRSAALAFAAAEVPGRLAQVAYTFGGFAAHGAAARAIVACVALAVVGATAAVVFGALRARLSLRERAVLALLVWLAMVIVALYLAQVSPWHAMGPRYLSVVWPLLAFVPVWLVRALPPRAAGGVLAALCLVAGAGAGALVWRAHAARAAAPTQHVLLAGADRVLVDSIARGVLPRVIPDLPDAAQVYAAPQALMLAAPDEWAGAEGVSSIYVSSGDYGNSGAGRAAVTARLGERHVVTPVAGGLDGLAYAAVIAARGAGDPPRPAAATGAGPPAGTPRP